MLFINFGNNVLQLGQAKGLTLHKLKIINDALPRALVTLTIAKLMNEPEVENNFENELLDSRKWK